MSLTKAQKIQKIEILEEKKRRKDKRKLQDFFALFYDWQHDFNRATASYRSCALMAANQVGKSLTGCVIDAHHITGNYPEDWEGHIFKKPITAWLLGYSGEKTRDLLQHKLFGRLNSATRELEGGLIHKDMIVDHKTMSGTVGAVREVRVKHKKGTSIVQFWSYSQGQHALMGDVVDWYHIDEEPEDQEIYPQVTTRTINGDDGRGGRGILTFTPENGKTELVTQFMDKPGKAQFIMNATWDQAPHLTKEMKEEILSIYPAYQKNMRSKGDPLMGAGLIYQFDEDKIKIDRFDIPDHWFLINGLDFGWDHPQAHIKMAWDRDQDIFYVTHAWKRSLTQPYEAWHVVRPWTENVPVAWPGDGLQHKQQAEGKEAIQLKALYEQAGFYMLHEHATWEDGGNGVWVGIGEINGMFKTGRLYIFSDLFEVLAEIRQYHTKRSKDGKISIVKILDDLLDAIRYAYMMRRYAERKHDILYPYVPDTYTQPTGGYTGD